MEPISSKKLWVFGYGSLCWHPGFDFSNQQLGFIRGFSRKFYQGNNAQRGTVDKPGRVATLIEEEEASTWGMAFELVGEMALKYLDQRECTLGGYRTLITTFYPRNGLAEPFPVLMYVAMPGNSQWLGHAPLHQIASQVAECEGTCGHNAEYVIRLADFFRHQLPEVWDDHLFTLDALVRQRMKEKNMNIRRDVPEPAQQPLAVPEAEPADPPAQIRRDSFQYQSRVGPKKLLCLKV